jgi:hypothetical protein
MFIVVVTVKDIVTLNNVIKTDGIIIKHIEHIDLEPTKLDAPPKVAPKEIPYKVHNWRTNKKPIKRFRHPSGKTAREFIVDFMKENGGHADVPEMKRTLKVQGFSPLTATGAIEELKFNRTIQKSKGPGYDLIKGKEDVI